MVGNQHRAAETAERDLIGACLLVPGVAQLACECVRPEDFGEADAREVFGAIARLTRRGAPLTEGSLAGELDLTRLNVATQCVARVPTGVFAGYYAQAVLIGACRRELVAVARQIEREAINGQTPASETMTHLAALGRRLAELEARRPFDVPAGAPTVYFAGTPYQPPRPEPAVGLKIRD